jgi:hypothetical protein
MGPAMTMIVYSPLLPVPKLCLDWSFPQALSFSPFFNLIFPFHLSLCFLSSYTLVVLRDNGDEIAWCFILISSWCV